jgi:proline iminopeptidase
VRRHSAFLASSLALLAVGSAAAAQTPGRPVTETGFVQVEPGIRLRYARIGHGSQAVVAPMGFLLQDSFRRLARNDRTLVLYDPRGRGRSDAVDASRVSFANELEDLERIRRHFGFGRMALIGWSHYGMMTAVYAIQNPSRVSRLIQMTPGSPARTPYLEEGMRTMQERVDGAAWKTLQERIRAGEFAADPEGRCRATKRLVLEAFVADRADVARIPLEDCRLPNEWEENQNRWWEALFGSMGDWDYRRQARSLSVPRLVIHGEKDFIPAGGSRDWAAGAEQARLLVLKEAGHFPHIERPDFFFPAVDRFLDGSWPDGAEAVSGTTPRRLREAGKRRRSAARSSPARTPSAPGTARRSSASTPTISWAWPRTAARWTRPACSR